MATLWQDIRIGLRVLARHPSFTLVAILILAVGIGATSAVLSVVQAVLLSALPYGGSERLVGLVGTLQREGQAHEIPVSYPDFDDWRRHDEVFEALTLHSSPISFNLFVSDELEHVDGELVAEDYLELVRSQPVVGRFFSPPELRPGADRVVVIGHDLWQRLFGGDPAVLGRRLSLNEVSYRVLGVMPAGFRGLSDAAEVWLPLARAPEAMSDPMLDIRSRRFRWLTAVGRLQPGVTLAQAQAAIDGLTAGLEERYPDTNRGIGVRLVPLSELWFGELRGTLFTLLGASGFVLLIACANTAGLFLVRAIARRREVALRSALGAPRIRLILQLLTESALLALIAGGLGLLLAHWFTDALVAASGLELRSFIEVGTDRRIIAAVAVIALACGLGFGLVPALIVSQVDLANAIKLGEDRPRSRGRYGFQDGMVIVELALGLALFVGAGLMVQGFRELRETDLGWRSRDVLSLRLDIIGKSLAEDEPRFALMRQILDLAPGLPGVESIALSSPGMPTDGRHTLLFTLEDLLIASPQSATVRLARHKVSPGYFKALGITLLEGRDFTREDHAAAPPVAVVSETLAQRYWPEETAIGKRLKIGRETSPAPWITVVGTVEDVRHQGLRRGADAERGDIYLTLFQYPPTIPPILNVMVRGDGSQFLELLRGEIRGFAPQLALYDAATLDERLRRQTAGDRFLVFLMNLFAAFALVMAATGIYGVIAYMVTRRSREISVRMALGAQSSAIVRLVVSRGLVLAAIGELVGIGLVLGLRHPLEGLTRSLARAEAPIYGAAALLLLLVALTAIALPAYRATKIDPAPRLRRD